CCEAVFVFQNLNEYVEALITLKQKIINTDNLLTEYQKKCDDILLPNSTLHHQVEQMLQKISPLQKCQEELGSLKAELEEKKSSLKLYQDTHQEYARVKEECLKTDAQKKKLEAKVKKLEEAAVKQTQDFKQLRTEKKILEKEFRKTQERLDEFSKQKTAKELRHIGTQISSDSYGSIDKRKVKLLLKELWLCINTTHRLPGEGSRCVPGESAASQRLPGVSESQDAGAPPPAGGGPLRAAAVQTCLTELSMEIEGDFPACKSVGTEGPGAAAHRPECVSPEGRNPEVLLHRSEQDSADFSDRDRFFDEDLQAAVDFFRLPPPLLSPVPSPPLVSLPHLSTLPSSLAPETYFGEYTDSSDDESSQPRNSAASVSEDETSESHYFGSSRRSDGRRDTREEKLTSHEASRTLTALEVNGVTAVGFGTVTAALREPSATRALAREQPWAVSWEATSDRKRGILDEAQRPREGREVDKSVQTENTLDDTAGSVCGGTSGRQVQDGAAAPWRADVHHPPLGSRPFGDLVESEGKSLLSEMIGSPKPQFTTWTLTNEVPFESDHVSISDHFQGMCRVLGKDRDVRRFILGASPEPADDAGHTVGTTGLGVDARLSSSPTSGASSVCSDSQPSSDAHPPPDSAPTELQRSEQKLRAEAFTLLDLQPEPPECPAGENHLENSLYALSPELGPSHFSNLSSSEVEGTDVGKGMPRVCSLPQSVFVNAAKEAQCRSQGPRTEPSLTRADSMPLVESQCGLTKSGFGFGKSPSWHQSDLLRRGSEERLRAKSEHEHKTDRQLQKAVPALENRGPASRPELARGNNPAGLRAAPSLLPNQVSVITKQARPETAHGARSEHWGPQRTEPAFVTASGAGRGGEREDPAWNMPGAAATGGTSPQVSASRRKLDFSFPSGSLPVENPHCSTGSKLSFSCEKIPVPNQDVLTGASAPEAVQEQGLLLRAPNLDSSGLPVDGRLPATPAPVASGEGGGALGAGAAESKPSVEVGCLTSALQDFNISTLSEIDGLSTSEVVMFLESCQLRDYSSGDSVSECSSKGTLSKDMNKELKPGEPSGEKYRKQLCEEEEALETPEEWLESEEEDGPLRARGGLTRRSLETLSEEAAEPSALHADSGAGQTAERGAEGEAETTFQCQISTVTSEVINVLINKDQNLVIEKGDHWTIINGVALMPNVDQVILCDTPEDIAVSPEPGGPGAGFISVTAVDKSPETGHPGLAFPEPQGGSLPGAQEEISSSSQSTNFDKSRLRNRPVKPSVRLSSEIYDQNFESQVVASDHTYFNSKLEPFGKNKNRSKVTNKDQSNKPAKTSAASRVEANQSEGSQSFLGERENAKTQRNQTQTILANADTSTPTDCSDTLSKIRQEVGPPLPPLLAPLVATPPRTSRPVSPLIATSTPSSPASPIGPISPLCEIPVPPAMSPLPEEPGCPSPPRTSPSPSTAAAGERILSSPLQFCAATPKHALPVPGRLPPFASAHAAVAGPQENSVKILDSMYPELSARARTLNILKGNIQLARGPPADCKNLAGPVGAITGFKAITSTSTAFVKTGGSSGSDCSQDKSKDTGTHQDSGGKRTLSASTLRSAKRLRLDSGSPEPEPGSAAAEGVHRTVRRSLPQAEGVTTEEERSALLTVSTASQLPPNPKETVESHDKAIADALKKIAESSFDLLPVIRSHVYVGNISKKPVMRDQEKEVVHEFSTTKKHLAECLLHSILSELKIQKISLERSYIHALCRVYVGICRQLGDLERARLFCYSLLKEDFPESEKLTLFIANMWHDIFISQSVINKAMQLVARQRAKGEVRNCLRAFLNWEKNAPVDVGFMVSKLLLTIQLCPKTEFQSSEKFGEDLSDNTWEYIFAIDLLCCHQKWIWTHDNIISKELWPVMDKWIKYRKGHANIAYTPDIIIASILRLIGRLGQLGLKEGFPSAVKSISSVIGMFIQHAQDEDIPWGIQLAAVYALCDLSPSNPAEISRILEAWRRETSHSVPSAVLSCLEEVSCLCAEEVG
uniref:Interactor of little elongation complex ELL subunit 1 n=1 Tax=Panthera tigris altaica TaxID=74533 RepID=A0A8C9JY81_PANTA